MVSVKVSNPTWQQMDVSDAASAGPTVDYLGIPVRDVDAEEQRHSYISQHRVSLCAIIALLALTSVCLLAVSLAGRQSAVALSSLSSSGLDEVALPSSWTDFVLGHLPSTPQLLPPTPYSSVADTVKDTINRIVANSEEDAKPDMPATTDSIATTLHTAPNVFYVVPFSSLLSSVLSASTFPSVFADVSSALSAARTFRSSGAVTSPIYIYLYPTLHFQSSTIRLTAEDSGSGESQPLVLTSMPLEAVGYFRGLKLKLSEQDKTAPAAHSADTPRAVLSGGRLLTGWTLTERASVYQLKVDDALVVNQLFVNNQRATRSRLPSKPTDFYQVKNTAQGQKTSMTVEPSVLSAVSNLAQVEFVVYHSWTASRHFYKSHQPSGFVETDNPTMWDFGFRQGAYLRYSIENAAEGMDRAGTWYFDTSQHTVYFWSDTHPDQLEVIVPVLDTVLAVEGSSDEAKRVKWVEVRDVDIAHSSWHIARGQSADYQATSWLSFATVHIQYACNLLFSNVHIHHTGSYAWWCEKGCTDVTLRDSQLSDTASGGARVGMDRVMQAGAVPPPPDVLRRVYVVNNTIHHTGKVFPDGVGVLQHRVEDSLISRNTIHHTYYSGISAGWEWGYEPSGSRNNTISYNYIHDIGQGLLTDQAGIYTLGSSNGGLITNNVIHNVHSWAGLDWGIYLDEGSVGWTVQDNIMYNTGWASFFLHYGRDNVLTNNVFARAGPLRGDYAVDWVEKQLSLTAERNIVFDTYQPPDANNKEPHVTFEAGNGVQVKLDYNTYWSVHSLDQRFGGAKQTLPEWQKSGQDQHSQYADPLFLHAEQCNFFELDPNSPAIKLGFKPIQRLEQWQPGCDDPTAAVDDEDGSVPVTLVPASQDTHEQAGKAMNQDQQAAEFMKRDKDDKDKQAAAQPTPQIAAPSDKDKSGTPDAGTLHTAPNVFYVVPFSSLLSSVLSTSTFPSVFADVSSALSAARTFRSSGAVTSPIYIYLYPTLHFQSSTIRLTAEDSGSGESQPLVLTSMPLEAVGYFRGLKLKLSEQDKTAPAAHSADTPRAVLSGGRLLTGWTLTERASVYQLKVDDALVVNQLFVNNQRATRSRLPSKPTDFYQVKNTAQGQKTSMTVEPSVLSAVSNLAQVEFVVYHSWTASRHFYKSHQPSGFVETDNPTMWDFGFRQGAYLRYSIENAAEGMDRAGTWYFDTSQHTVYFWSDTHPDQLEVIVPVLDTVLAVEGSSDEAKRVKWVEVRDVDIAHSSWHIARGQSADYQATSWLSFATVHIQYACNLLFSNVHIHHTGSYAWWCEKGCTDVTLRDSQLSDTASGGARVGMDRVMQAGAVPPPPDVLRRVYVVNNTIHHTGKVFPDGVGVLQHRVEDSLISRNTIHHTYYSGISAGWEWGYEPSGSRNNTISYNYIHDIGQGLLTDQAGIYTLGSSNGGLITNNVIHNVHSWAGLDWGIYLDEGSVGWTVQDNIMYNTGWASFFLHYGRDNVLTNNVFARAGPLRGDYAVDWVEKQLSLTAERNIVFDTYQPPDANNKEPHVTFEAGNGVQVKLDYNTYWSVHSLDQRFGGAKQTLPEWQKSGQDQHSQYADPLFLHAEQCNFFELDPNSPAIKLGFKPIQRLEQWQPGCDDPTAAVDDEDGSVPVTLVPASQDTHEQAGKAMNQDQQAAEFMKRDKDDKDKQAAAQPTPQIAAPSDKDKSGTPDAGTLHTAPNVFYVVPFSSLLSSVLSASTFPSVFADVSSALSAARTFRSSGAVTSPIYIYLYPTLHFQSSTIRLTAEDSGSGESQPLVLTSMPLEAVGYFRGLKLKLSEQDKTAPAAHSADTPRAVLSGGRLLTGWTLTERASVYQLKVDDALVVNQLFVNNQRATRSRLPSKPTDFYQVKNTAQGQKTSMTVEPSVLSAVSNLAQVEFVVYHSWTASRHFYKSHQPSGFVETDNPTMWDFGFRQGAYLRYSIENAAEGMDRAGTWYFDTSQHTVYFWSDTHPDQLEVIVPVLDTVLAVEGSSDEAKRVKWVEVRDVDIAHSSWHIARGQSADYQATSWLSFATVHIQYACNLLFSNVHIHHTGSYAWWCEKGCTDVTLRDSQLSDTASGGARVGMDRVMQAGAVPPPPDVLRRVYVVNNTIHHTGKVFPDGVGVLQHRVEDSLISRNTIHHTYYSGISAGWEWGYEPSGSRNNTISYNYIHDIGQGLLTDQAGIYTLGSSNGGLITNNVIHNVHSWAGLDWGIYLDEGSVGWTVQDNIMYNTGWASFFLHYGRDNVLTNNVFARAGPLRGDYAVDWVEKQLSLTAERNIVFDTYQPPDANNKEPHVTFEAGNGVQVKLDYNTYWSVHSLDQRFGGAKQTLPEWQKSGQDQHSQYADPLFLHAEQCNFFELDPNSPAIKLGFKPIQRLEQWQPGCDDPTAAVDDEDGSVPVTLVPASQDTHEQAGKAMNQDQQAAEFMKRDKDDKDKQAAAQPK